MKTVLISALAAAMLVGGCAAPRYANEYDGRTYDRIKQIDYATVLEHRPVLISDDGSGQFVGMLIGAVLGSTVGRGEGRALAALAGGLAGSYVGSDAGKANAQELTVRLDSGEIIAIVVKEGHYLVNDRIKIIREHNRVETVTRVPSQGY